jgi:RNA polymerase sigma factor (sigma-70 family)
MDLTKVNLVEKFKTYTDLEIIDKIIAGEKGMFEILIRRNNPYLYKVGRGYGFNHEDTEDLMQEAYINAYTHLADFKNLSEFKTWIVRIMLNQCYQKTQKSSFKNEIPSEIKHEEKKSPLFNSNIHDAEHMMINKELGQLIESALIKIPLNYRMVFSLRELNGLSVQATSEALNISETNVKVRLNRAKTMLKKELESMYSPAEIFEFNLVYCDRIVERVMSQLATVG